MDKVMKYLKEGKWEDFNKNMEELRSSAKTINDQIESIRKELISNIADCMVDLEDYLTEYSIDDQDLLSGDGEDEDGGITSYCAYYGYRFEGIYDLDMFINFLENKLNEYIGKDSYLLLWEAEDTNIRDFYDGHTEGSYDEFKKDFDSGYITADKDNKFDIEFLFYDKVNIHNLKKWIR